MDAPLDEGTAAVGCGIYLKHLWLWGNPTADENARSNKPVGTKQNAGLHWGDCSLPGLSHVRVFEVVGDPLFCLWNVKCPFNKLERKERQCAESHNSPMLLLPTKRLHFAMNLPRNRTPNSCVQHQEPDQSPSATEWNTSPSSHRDAMKGLSRTSPLMSLAAHPSHILGRHLTCCGPWSAYWGPTPPVFLWAPRQPGHGSPLSMENSTPLPNVSDLAHSSEQRRTSRLRTRTFVATLPCASRQMRRAFPKPPT